MSGGGGSGNDGSNDMQVSGMEAAMSTEKGISTHAESRVGRGNNQGNINDEFGTGGNVYDSGPDTSTVGIASDLGMSQTQLDKATAKNIVDLVDSGVNVNDAISGKTSVERILQGKGPFLTVRALGEVLRPFANAANTKRRSNWIEGTDKFGMPRSRDFYIQHKRAYNPNAVLVKGTPEYEFLKDSGYFESIKDMSPGDSDDNTYYDNPEDVKLVENVAANRFDSVAAKFFGNSANKFKFSFENEYGKALARQKTLLNKPSAVGLLAVNQSPFYNWLKDNSLDKGIL